MARSSHETAYWLSFDRHAPLAVSPSFGRRRPRIPSILSALGPSDGRAIRRPTNLGDAQVIGKFGEVSGDPRALHIDGVPAHRDRKAARHPFGEAADCSITYVH